MTDRTDNPTPAVAVAGAVNPSLEPGTEHLEPAVLYITDWDDHYEVNKDNGQWRPGQTKRKGPLPYVRSWVFGPAGDNLAYIEAAQTVNEKFGEGTWCIAWGLFCKLIEVAARQKADLRGYLLGRRGSAISPRMIQTITGFANQQIELGLRILTDDAVGWIQERQLPASANSPTVGDGRRSLQEKQEQEQTNTKQEQEQDSAREEPQASEAVVVSDGPDGVVEISLGRDSDSGSNGSGNARADGKAPGRLLMLLKGYLWSSTATQKQQNADWTCLTKIAGAVAGGALGDADLIEARCIDKAKHLHSMNGNRMAMFCKRFNDQLPDDMTIRDLANGMAVGSWRRITA